MCSQRDVGVGVQCCMSEQSEDGCMDALFKKLFVAKNLAQEGGESRLVLDINNFHMCICLGHFLLGKNLSLLSLVCETTALFADIVVRVSQFLKFRICGALTCHCGFK